LRALGVSPLRALAPGLAAAGLLCAGLVWFNDKVLPESNYRAAALRNDIGRKKPTALISARRLIRDFEGYQIWIDQVNDRTGALRGVRIYQPEPGKPLRYTYADSASLEYVDGGKNLLIHLRHGVNHGLDPRNPAGYARIRFISQTVTLPNVDAALRHQERTYRTDREMSLRDMRDVVSASRQRLAQLRGEYADKIFDDMRVMDLKLSVDTGPVPPRLRETPWTTLAPPTPGSIADALRQEREKIYHIERYEARARNELTEISQYSVEIHKKFSIPVACLVFVLIGAPLGVMARRGGIGTGVLYSIFFFLVYWVGMIRGEALADRLAIPPWAAMWGPDFLVGAGGAWLVWRMVREKYVPDRRPFGGLRALLRLRARPPGRPAGAALE
jgi:lipopolysaccharide export system permease protein